MFWDERKVHLAAVIVLTLALLVVLTITTINLNNTTTLLTTAILNNKSDWTAIRTFSFSATDLTSGGKTIDISGGGKFCYNDRYILQCMAPKVMEICLQ